MGDEQTSNLGRTVFQEIEAGLGFCVCARRLLYAPRALELFQTVIAM